MIRFNDVSKEYKSKRGQITKALTNINFTLQDKGLIFIIGKSGSGKSTLLNILGGLDNKTTGKIYIDNKDIDNFKEKDFDNYRNTYIGFIFQDFNLLEEYNVFDNIMISAKLVRKKVNKNEILNLLNKLDLNGLEYRNINELSGGQKQRVGIARALIKNPKIILADEPTGNLDSTSSLEIFKLLKEISKEKLVVVVSHDLENAYNFKDKILELQDGNIIKNELIDNDTPSNNFSIVKSKLPFKECLHFAFNSLKSNKIKLFFTIILTVISLAFLGISVNSYLYNKGIFMSNVMKDNNEYIFDIAKSDININGGGYYKTNLTSSDKKYLEKETNTILNPIYTLYDNSKNISFKYGEVINIFEDKEFKDRPLYFNIIDVQDNKIIPNLIGKYPTKNNEIVIHKYVAKYMIKYGVKTKDGTIYKPNSLDELIKSKKEVMLGNNPVIITGYVNIDKEDSINHFSYIYTKDFVDSAILNYNEDEILTNYTYLSTTNNKETLTERNVNIYNNEELLYSNKNNLDNNEIIISLNYLKKINDEFNKELDNYLLENSNRDYNSLLKEFTANYLNTTNYLNTLSLKLSISVNDDYYENNVKVIGISYNDINYITKDYFNSLLVNNNNKVIKGYRVYEDNYNNLANIINSFETNVGKEGNYYYLTLPHDIDLNMIDAIYIFLAKYISIVTLVFILFTILLFSNFIYISIIYSKKQIGILRALGTNKNDIIKIFLYESIIIGIISYIISIILWFISINLLNNSLFGNKTYILNGIVTNPLVPIIMFIYTIIISIIITIISLSKITKIKPIDAILKK